MILFTTWSIHSTKERQEKVFDLFFTSCPDLIPGLKALKCRILLSFKDEWIFAYGKIFFFFEENQFSGPEQRWGSQKVRRACGTFRPWGPDGPTSPRSPCRDKNKKEEIYLQIELLYLCVLTIMIFPACPYLLFSMLKLYKVFVSFVRCWIKRVGMPLWMKLY